MNKLIVSVAAICVAFAANAAVVGWTLGGANGYSNYSMFVINQNGVTGIDQIKAIVSANGLSGASSYAFGSGALNNGAAVMSATASGKDIKYSGSGIDSYSGFIFVEDAAGEKASYSSLAKIDIANDSSGKTFLFGSQADNLSSNSFTVGSSVPEPTSGLLLLLGMAGLALRRRRA